MIATTFKYADLNDRAKARARDWYREGTSQDFEAPREYIAQALEMLGIDVGQRSYKTVGGSMRIEPDISFALGYSQGDGAAFGGTWHADRMRTEELLADRPADEALHAIAAAFMAFKLRWPTSSARWSPEWENINSSLSWVDCGLNDAHLFEAGDEFDTMQAIGRDIDAWMYETIRAEYEYQISDERVEEGIEAGDYDFDEDGRPA